MVTSLRLNVAPRPILCAVVRFPDGTVRARLGDETRGRLLTDRQVLGLRGMLGEVLAAMFQAEREAATDAPRRAPILDGRTAGRSA